MARNILRNLAGRLLGLDKDANLVLGGSKIFYNHNTNADTEFDLAAGGASSAYDPATSGLIATTVQAAIDEIMAQRIDNRVLLGKRYGFNGNNSFDNASAIDAMATEAQSLIAAGYTPLLVPGPGIFRSSARHMLPGGGNLDFTGATFRATGTNETAPLLTWGETGGSVAVTGGSAIGVNCDSIVTTQHFTNRNFVGFRAMNKTSAYIRTGAISAFTIDLQLAADGITSYNIVDIGALSVATAAVELNSYAAGTPFSSENVLRGGNIISTSGLNNYGSAFGISITREYDTGYAGNGGNFWYKPSFQMQPANLSWSSGGSATVGYRYYGPLTGSEWYCKTAGVFSSTEPSLIPTVAAGTRADKTSITTSAGSAIVTMASTAGISAGWHMRGTNPLSNFPFDTYVLNVDSGTQLTLTNVAASNSTTYKAYFIAPLTDNTAVLVYVGPYKRGVIWNRDGGTSNAIYDARRETGIGEAIINSGPYLYPQAFSGTMTWETRLTLEGESVTIAKDCRFPKWAAGATYALGDMVVPATVGAVFLECIVAGAAHASVEPTTTVNVGTTLTDNAVTWIVRAMPTTATRGDIGIYTGSSTEPKGYVSHYTAGVAGATFSLDNLHQKAIGSATGWLVKGACKNTTGGTLSQSFAAGDFALNREGLRLLSTTSELGFLVRTDKHKYFRYRKHFGPYSSNRGHLMTYDKALLKMNCTTAQSAYNPRLYTLMTVTGAFAFADTSDSSVDPHNFLVGTDVPYVFYGIVKGSTGTPAACVLNGLSITALPFETTETAAPRIECFTPYGMSEGPRASLGVPTNGFFFSAGEFIQNGSTGAGLTMGYYVATAGILVPDWVTSTTYVRGDLVAGTGGDANRIFAANGSFVSGTAPTGAVQNILDGTATSIVSGDVATWDYMGPKAVLTASAALN